MHILSEDKISLFLNNLRKVRAKGLQDTKDFIDARINTKDIVLIGDNGKDDYYEFYKSCIRYFDNDPEFASLFRNKDEYEKILVYYISARHPGMLEQYYKLKGMPYDENKPLPKLKFPSFSIVTEERFLDY